MPSGYPKRDKEERKAERRRKSDKYRDDSFSPIRDEGQQGQVYVGADAVDGQGDKRSSFHVFNR